MAQEPDHDSHPERTLHPVDAHFVIVGGNRSVLHAGLWLKKSGAVMSGAASVAEALAMDPPPTAILVSGDTIGRQPDTGTSIPVIYLWDYEVDRPGTGAFASAVSGVSAVIGRRDGAPGVLPVHVPEQWAGIFGANLALGQVFRRQNDEAEIPTHMDVSAADVLRAFAEQNSGNHAGVPYGWRRNGLTAVEHGGVFPQGFFRCKDGYVAVQARSRQDWAAILAAFGNPEWSSTPEMQDPFKLSEDDSRILPLFQAELQERSREELLDLALKTGAPMAPVLTPDEASKWDVFRPGFHQRDGGLRAPFVFNRLSA